MQCIKIYGGAGNDEELKKGIEEDGADADGYEDEVQDEDLAYY